MESFIWIQSALRFILNVPVDKTLNVGSVYGLVLSDDKL